MSGLRAEQLHPRLLGRAGIVSTSDDDVIGTQQEKFAVRQEVAEPAAAFHHRPTRSGRVEGIMRVLISAEREDEGMGETGG